jgi:hypothetical protein
MDIEQRLAALEQRNAKVDSNKAWEGSWTRRGFIMLVTYAVAVAWLWAIHESNLWLKAVVPVAGFLLSTLTIGPLKQVWVRTVYKK